MSSFRERIEGSIEHFGHQIKSKLRSWEDRHSHTHSSGQCGQGLHDAHAKNRFLSFAPERQGNEAKWYVDACGYMWAVSVALEQAKESIWILDCKSISMQHADP
jgi:phospholipase D1/2